MPQNFSNFIIEPPPIRESEGLVRLGQTIQQNREWEYRHQKDLEAEQYRKANLIQELTDLSKHQTGSDVANAVGDKLMTDVYQKYTANADKMSYLDLVGGLQKDMSGIITGMDTMKNELANLDKQMMAIKTAHPDLDTARMYDEARKDVIHRRLRDDTQGFRNEMEVPPPQIDLTNPETLSKYVTGSSNLKKYFANPQGLDPVKVYTGNDNRYHEFTVKGIPSWRELNYDPQKLEGGLFLPKNIQRPSLKFKSQRVSVDDIPSSKNNPFEVIDEKAYKEIGGKEKLELMQEARRWLGKYGVDYDKVNPEEKELAERKVALDIAKDNDKSDFYGSQIHTPSAAMLKYYSGGNGGANNKPIELQDVHKEVMDAASNTPDGKVNLPDLTPEAQGIILDITNKLMGRGGDLKMNQNQVYVQKEGNDLNIVNAKDGKVITKFPYKSANLPANPGLKAKQEVLKNSNHQKVEGSKKVYKGLDKDGNPIFE